MQPTGQPEPAVEEWPSTREEAGTLRPRIMNRGLLLLFVASFGAMTCFYMLLSVVPLYATSVGAGGIGAGLATGALMFATVAVEFATPRLVAVFGYRLLFGAGLLLLGAPALALPASTEMAAILSVSLVRGMGFAIVVVVGSALVATLVPPERRGEGLGLYGAVVGVPSIVALPLGVWLAGQLGYTPVFVIGAVAALVGLAVVPGLPGREPALKESVSVMAGLRMPSLLRPGLLFSATTMASGIVVTFLPLAVAQGSGDPSFASSGPGSGQALAALALFVQSAASTAGRWWAGRRGDRHGSANLLIPGVLASTAGMLALVLTGSPGSPAASAAIVGGMLVFGVGFGITQNATLALMFDRVPRSGYGMVSALWNVAYDAGLGLGATGFGLLAARTGYPAGFAIAATVVLAALVPAWRDRTTDDRRPTTDN